MPFMPSGQETDWAYSTVPGTRMGQLKWDVRNQDQQQTAETKSVRLTSRPQVLVSRLVKTTPNFQKLPVIHRGHLSWAWG